MVERMPQPPEIEAAIEQLEYLLRGTSPLDSHERDEPMFAEVPAVVGLLEKLAKSCDMTTPVLRLSGERLLITFETPWSPPTRTVSAFARSHPELGVSLNYAEPGNSIFGRPAYQNGGRTENRGLEDEEEAKAVFATRGSDFADDYLLNTALLLARLAVARARGRSVVDADQGRCEQARAA
jgi:hypothetical protein